MILRSFAVATLFLLACGDKAGPGETTTPAGGGDKDPCAGVELPACPPECTAPVGQLAGQACEAGSACGNQIGDGCTCNAQGTWDCQPHRPLGPGCNLVCR
ncbi:MAG TPA: hypothetical protein VMZ28_29365 [Kofleriaceae bacterium]|nr:hypothetical protein [Kofleriaceae bacterium]